MKIMIINPNSSEEMTNHIRQTIETTKRLETELLVICPNNGPTAIESAYDEIYAAFYSMDLVKKANREKFDAIIIACFSDPGLIAMKEISNILVVGIQEVSLHTAAMLGHKFTILTMSKERIPSKYNNVWCNKLPFNLASVRELGMTVTETDQNPDFAQRRILDVATEAIEKDGAEVIILGCAGMTGYSEMIAKRLNVTVIDPTLVTFKYVEAMVEIGIKQSKKGLYASPF
jgi:allantoin racemase